MQEIAGLSAVGMTSTKLFPGRNARLHALRGYFIIHGDKNARLEIAGINDYSFFAHLERLKNDIHRCDRIGVEDTHTKSQPKTFR